MTNVSGRSHRRRHNPGKPHSANWQLRPPSLSGRVHEGYDTWYVTIGTGMTYCDNGRDLRPVPNGCDDSGQIRERIAAERFTLRGMRGKWI